MSSCRSQTTTCYLLSHKVLLNSSYIIHYKYMCQVIIKISQTQNYIFDVLYLRSEIVQIGGYYSTLIADRRLLELNGLQISFRYIVILSPGFDRVSCPDRPVDRHRPIEPQGARNTDLSCDQIITFTSRSTTSPWSVEQTDFATNQF